MLINQIEVTLLISIAYLLLGNKVFVGKSVMIKEGNSDIQSSSCVFQIIVKLQLSELHIPDTWQKIEKYIFKIVLLLIINK